MVNIFYRIQHGVFFIVSTEYDVTACNCTVTHLLHCRKQANADVLLLHAEKRTIEVSQHPQICNFKLKEE
jgi:hypothetical protein